MKSSRLPALLFACGVLAFALVTAVGVAATYTGSITNGDLMHVDANSGNVAGPSTCTGNAPPGTAGTTDNYHYDTHSEVIPSTSCVTITLSVATGSSGGAFATAYLGSFNPGNLMANYVADIGPSQVAPGSSTSFKANVPGGSSVVVVVEQFDPNLYVEGCGQTNCYTLIIGAPTSVAVRSLSAKRTGSALALSWRTASEVDILGFNVYREQTRLNPALIAARSAGTSAGHAYRFVDPGAMQRKSLRYRLQIVHPNGTRSWAGTIRVY
jgi:hypothetical protein